MSFEGTTTIIRRPRISAPADDFVEFRHYSVLFGLRPFHVEKAQGVVGEHFQLVGFEPVAEPLRGYFVGRQVAVEALGLDVDEVKPITLAEFEVS